MVKKISKNFGKFKTHPAFTVIEVMIVLAIAGTIMAVVFLAIPQVQRSSRDSQRRGTTLRIKSELETYSANNEGVYPFNGPSGTPVSASLCNTQTGTTGYCGDWFDNYICSDSSYNGVCSSGGIKVRITDPSTAKDVNIYYDNTIATPTGTWNPGDVYIIVGGQCSGSPLSGSSGNASSQRYALMMMRERQNNWFCVDNS